MFNLESNKMYRFFKSNKKVTLIKNYIKNIITKLINIKNNFKNKYSRLFIVIIFILGIIGLILMFISFFVLLSYLGLNTVYCDSGYGSDGDSAPEVEPDTNLTYQNGVPVRSDELDDIMSHPDIITQTLFASANQLFETNPAEATETLKTVGVEGNEVEVVKDAVKEGLAEANQRAEQCLAETLSPDSVQEAVATREEAFS